MHVTIRELRNRGGEVVERVEAGERLVVTKDGRPVAELRPLPSRGVSNVVLLARWRRLPLIDSVEFRRDLDNTLDSHL